MNHNDNAYAAMLLTMALSPNREEYARPCSVQEFCRLEALVRGTRFHTIGKLIDVDISGLMLYLGISEEEAYRLYTLLHRGVQLSYALEGFMREGIDVVTLFDADYPQRVQRRLGESRPPFFYRCGAGSLLERRAIAIVGISGVRTTPEVREAVEKLVADAVRLGYGIITGGEMGVSRVAAASALACGGTLLDVLGGGLHEHVEDEVVASLIGSGRGAAVSLEHPDAMFTVSHAIARNKLLFALADAAFIFNTDGKRGESDALNNRTCDWIYAWEGGPGNATLISRGAIPLRDIEGVNLDELCVHWNSARSEQMNMFDLLG